jgi:chemotaxis signal transduction protein
MTTLVCFQAGEGDYAMPVEHVREVRSGDTLMPLPSPRSGVVGLLSFENDALAVIDTLGAGRNHVLLLDAGGRPFGLCVKEVTGVIEVDEIGPAPAGQDDNLIAGVITTDAGLKLVVDVDALAEQLRT